MSVDTDIIATSNAVNYLGLRLECKLTLWDQIRTACGECSFASQRTDGQRRGTVAQWTTTLDIRHPFHTTVCMWDLIWRFDSGQILKADSCGSIERSTPCGKLTKRFPYRRCTCVLAGVIPINLLARENKRVYERGDVAGRSRSPYYTPMNAGKARLEEGGRSGLSVTLRNE